MMMDSVDLRKQLDVFARAGAIQHGDGSCLFEFDHEGTKFQVFHLVPPQSPSEKKHQYSSQCWCDPMTDGALFVHMRAH
jgi:hypothetical protein